MSSLSRLSKWTKKHWKALTVFALFFFAIGFFQAYHLPRFEKWLSLKIEDLSSQHGPIRVWPRQISVQFFPLGIEAHGVRMLPKSNIGGTLAPFEIGSVQAELSFLGLLTGKLRLASLKIDTSEVKLILPDDVLGKEDTEAVKSTHREKIFSFVQLRQIPIDSIELSNIDVFARLKSNNISVKVSELELVLQNYVNGIELYVNTPRLYLKKSNEDPVMDLSFRSKLFAKKTGIEIDALTLKKEDSFIVASGELIGDIQYGEVQSHHAKLRTRVLLNDVRKVLKELLPHQNVPLMQGIFSTDLDVKLDSTNDLTVSGVIEGSKIKIDKYVIGDIEGQGRFAKQSLNLPRLIVKNSAGEVRLENSQMTMANNNFEFTTQARAKSVEVRQLLKNLGVGDIPVQLYIDGVFPCKGNYTDQLNVTCTGTAQGRQLLVKTDWKNSNSLVDMPQFETIGKVDITEQDVSFNATVSAGTSKGSARGKVSYEKGFAINYQGDIKDFAIINNQIAGLKIEGAADLSGSTKGSSQYGTIEMKANAHNLWFENFALGNVSSYLRYKDGVLTFKDVSGMIDNSRYKGNLSVNLQKEQLFVNAEIPYVEAEDALKVLSRTVKIPFEVTGSGSAEIKVFGPFALNRLSYEFKTELYRGSIFGENYEQFIFDVRSANGYVESNKVELLTAGGSIKLKGKAQPTGQIEAIVVGKNLRLEQSENIKKFDLNVDGQLDATMRLYDSILSPQLELDGRLSKLVLDDKPADDSTFSLVVNDHSYIFSTNLFNNSLQSLIRWPFKAGHPLEIKTKTTNFDFARAFSNFSKVSSEKGFDTNLTGELNLFSPSGQFKNSSGFIRIDDLRLQRGSIFITNRSPMHVNLQDGLGTLQNFEVQGGDSHIQVSSKQFTYDNFNIQVNGKMDMTLMNLFIPFLEELRGQLSISLETSGKIFQPDLLGSAYIQNGYVKIPAFPHPFEEASADVLFSQKKILVNSLKGKIGGGQFTGTGLITVNGPNNVPVDISGNFDKVSLNVPDGFRTRGSGSLYFRGHRFPYTLGGSYDVYYGDVNKNLRGNQSKTESVQPSRFLPQLLDATVSPIQFDLKIDLKNTAMVNMVFDGGIAVDTPIDGQVHVKGTPSAPLLTGQLVTGKDGKAIFRKNEFELRNAQIEYKNAAPSNPSLFVNAEARVQDYDVNMLVQGTAINPQLTFSSQPPLPEHEIISLLALGITSSELDQKFDPSQQESQTQFQIGSAIVEQQLGMGQQIRDNLGFEVDISSVQDTDESIKPAFAIRKQWTPKFGASATRSIGETPTTNVKFEYKFNRNFSVSSNWEQKDSGASQLQDNKDTNQDKIGIDFEYKVEFR